MEDGGEDGGESAGLGVDVRKREKGEEEIPGSPLGENR